MTNLLTDASPRGLVYDSPVTIQVRVIAALILRDMRTRFGRTFMGWAIMVLWPLTHLVFMMLGYLVAHRVAPIGTSVTVFVGTGVLPYILCLYPARMIMMSVLQNQSLLQFPPVHVIDIVIARSILEIVNSFWVVFLFCIGLFVMGIDFLPYDYTDAIFAILATIYLGLSIGIISAILIKLTRAWLAIQIGLLIGGYIASGALVPLSAAPSWLRTILWFNPLVHCVSWLRAAYYDAFGDEILSRSYLLGYATALLLLSLILERMLRGLLMQSS